MDLLQIVITVLSVLGIVVMGAMAIVPEVMQVQAGRAEKQDAVRQSDHELVA